MNSQIDPKLDRLLNLNKIEDKDMEEYLGQLPSEPGELLSVLKNLRSHIRTQGRKSDALEVYNREIKKCTKPVDTLVSDLLEIVELIDVSNNIKNKFIRRINLGNILKTENSADHLVVHIVSFSSRDKKVLLVHHKKADSWIFPGGHVEPGETLRECALRESDEELGLVDADKFLKRIIFLSTTHIDNEVQKCKLHYDVWYLLDVNSENVRVDMKEFLDYKWLKEEEAKSYATLPSIKNVLNILNFNNK